MAIIDRGSIYATLSQLLLGLYMLVQAGVLGENKLHFITVILSIDHGNIVYFVII